MSESFRTKFLNYLLNDSIPAAAVKSAWSGFTLPGDVLAGKVDPMSEEGQQRALQAAGLALTGNVAATSTRSTRGLLASAREMEHDPPQYPPRPFEADYPNGAVADETGRLQYDIEGRPLTARRVAGRVYAGQADQAISEPGRMAGVVSEVTGQPPSLASRSDLNGSGATSIDPTGRPEYVLLADDLHSNDVPRVLGHETGHVIDQTVGNIPTDGIEQQLLKNYDTLYRGNRPGKHVIGPTDVGYPPEQAGQELIAEGIRAYLQDPNYIKTVAPDTAARIRAYVNSHPKLKDIIQFNSIGLGAAGAAAGLAGWRNPPPLDDKRFGELYRAGRAS